MDSLIVQLYQSKKSILTRREIAIIWSESNSLKLNSKIAYYTKQGAIQKITRGVYALGKEYDVREVATSIYQPSYISFETVLREAGIIFQHSDTIFVASKLSRNLDLNGHRFVFRKIKDVVLYSPIGITMSKAYPIASLERAFLDMIYLFPNYYFDNLAPLNWQKCHELADIYNNKQLFKRLNNYHKSFAR